MKVLYQVGPVFSRDLGEECIDQLVAIYPEGKGTRACSFIIEAPENDSRLRSAIGLLEGRGLKPRRIGASPEFYPLRIKRHYDRADLEAAQFLEFFPRCEVDKATTRPFPGGPLQIKAQQMRGKVKLFSLSWPVTGVVREVKEAMEASSLRGVAFEPVECIGPGAERWAGQIWRLASTVRLPPLAPSCKLIQTGPHGSEPFAGDYSRVVTYQEEFYTPAEKHYRQSDLAPLGEFALGHTFERFGHVGEQTFIAGKPFYEFCVKHRFKIDWWPVRIDPD